MFSLKQPLLCTITGTFLAVCGFAGDFDGYSKKELIDYINTTAEMVSAITPSSGNLQTVFSNSTIAASVSLEEYRQRADEFRKSIHFKLPDSTATRFTLEADFFRIPYPRLSHVKIMPQSVLTQSGINVLDTSANTNTHFNLVSDQPAPTVHITRDKDQHISHVEGTIVVWHPVTIAKIKLASSSINKIFKIGMTSCKLLRLNKDLAVIWGDGASPLDIYLLSNEGMVLEQQKNTTGPFSLYEKKEPSKKLPKKLVKKYINSPDSLYNEGTVYSIHAKGYVASVVVVAPTERTIDTLPYVAFSRPAIEQRETTPHEQYAAPGELPLWP